MTLFSSPVIGQETPNRIDEQALAYWGGGGGGIGDGFGGFGLGGDRPSQPIAYERRETFTHIHKFCEPQYNPPEGWLRPNGFCGITDARGNGTLLFTGADYNFGFKSR